MPPGMPVYFPPGQAPTQPQQQQPQPGMGTTQSYWPGYPPPTAPTSYAQQHELAKADAGAAAAAAAAAGGRGSQRPSRRSSRRSSAPSEVSSEPSGGRTRVVRASVRTCKQETRPLSQLRMSVIVR